MRTLFDVPLRAHFELKEFPGRVRGVKARGTHLRLSDAWAGHSGLVYRSRWCILMGGPSVARPAILMVPLRTPYDCKKVPRRVFGRVQITCAEIFCGCVHGQAASGSCFDRDIAHFDRRAVVARPELRALFDVPLRALFGYGVILGRVWA